MVEKSKINDTIYDVVDYKEFSRHPQNYGKYSAVREGDFVYPVRTKNDNGVGIYDDGVTYRFVEPSTEEEKESYSIEHIINFSDCNTIKEVIKAQEEIRKSERSILTRVDNVFVAPIGHNDSPHMAALKQAINEKGIDLDKYEPRFGQNYNNDRRLLTKDDITMNKFKSFLNKLDLKATMTIEDASDDVPNPLGRKIVVPICSNDENDDE